MMQYERPRAYPELQGKPSFVRGDSESGQWARQELLPKQSARGRPGESRRAHTERLIEAAGVPAHFRHKGWHELADDATFVDQDGVKQSVKDSLSDYADRIDHMLDDGWGLVLIGPAGWGKSLGAALVAMEAINAGYWVRFTSFAQLVQREIGLIKLEAAARDVDGDGDWRALRRETYRLQVIKEHCDLLVVDDVGKEHRTSSDFAGDQLDLVLRTRQTAGKTTILTTNLPERSWATYNSSMVSFLFELGDVIEYLDGSDKRLQRRRPVRRPA